MINASFRRVVRAARLASEGKHPYDSSDKARVMALIEFIGTLEWSGSGISPAGAHAYACPCCKGHLRHGHNEGCQLRAILDSVKVEPQQEGWEG